MCDGRDFKDGLIQKFELLDGFIEARDGQIYAIIPIGHYELKDGSRIKGTLRINGAVIPTHNEIVIDVLPGMIDYGYIQINTPYQIDKNLCRTCFPPDNCDFEFWVNGKRCPGKYHVASSKIYVKEFFEVYPNLKPYESKIKITIDKPWKKYTLTLIEH